MADFFKVRLKFLPKPFSDSFAVVVEDDNDVDSCDALSSAGIRDGDICNFH